MNSIIDSNTKQVRQPLTIPARNIVRYDIRHDGLHMDILGKRKSISRPMKLKDTASMLTKIGSNQNANDIHVQSNRLKLVIENGRAYGVIISRDRVSEKMPFTKTGLQSLISNTKKGLAYGSIDKHWTKTETGDKITSALYSNLTRDDESQLLVRTINRGNDRVIRSVHPAGHHGCYQPFSHLDLVNNFLQGAPEYRDSTVLSLALNDDGFRIKMASPDLASGDVIHEDIRNIEVNKPINVFQLRNSETGRGSLGIDSGIWTLVCSNGMTTYDGQLSRSTPHKGQPDRLAGWFTGTTEDILTKQYGILDKYDQALDTYVDDLFEFTKYTFEQAAKSGRHKKAVNDDVIESVINDGLTDPTTPQNKSVAQVAQAIALIAQQHDFSGESLLEEIALDTINRGLGMANNGRVVVPVNA